MEAERHIYRSNPRDLFIDIYRPDHSDLKNQLPAIVFYFGGGWKNGGPDQFRPFAMHLARRGMIAAVAEYRTESSDAVPPFECVSDAKSVMRFLRAQSLALGIDPQRIAAGGGSAGGHLAAACACVENWNHVDDDCSVSARPNLLALFNPVVHNGPEGYGFDRVGEQYKDFSPFHRVHNEWPATCIFLGTEDSIISVSMMQTFVQSVRDHGADCEDHYYEGQPHGFFNYKQDPPNPYYEQTLAKLDAFMVKHGYIGPVLTQL